MHRRYVCIENDMVDLGRLKSYLDAHEVHARLRTPVLNYCQLKQHHNFIGGLFAHSTICISFLRAFANAAILFCCVLYWNSIVSIIMWSFQTAKTLNFIYMFGFVARALTHYGNKVEKSLKKCLLRHIAMHSYTRIHTHTIKCSKKNEYAYL